MQFSETYAFNFTGCQPTNGTIEGTVNEEGDPLNYVEHIQIFLTVRYAHRGFVRVQAVSPSGKYFKSRIALTIKVVLHKQTKHVLIGWGRDSINRKCGKRY